jgi:hypothetical protein
MSNLFIDLSTKVAETVFRLKDVSPYTDLRYSVNYNPSTTPYWEKQNILVRAESDGGSTLWYQCYYIPKPERIFSVNNLGEALDNPSISLTIDQVVAEIAEKFGPKTES